MLGLPFGDQKLATNPRYTHFCRNKKRIINNNDVVYRQNYNNVGDFSQLQVLLTVPLKETLLNSLHSEARKHPGVSKMTKEIKQKLYFSSLANHYGKWVKECQTCVQDKKFDHLQTTAELIIMPELGPEDVLQIDLQPELQPGGGYENNIRAFDVISRYAFATPASNTTAVKTSKIIIDIMTRHAYLLTLTVTDLRSVFVSNVIH